jgi:hypothetical protein
MHSIVILTDVSYLSAAKKLLPFLALPGLESAYHFVNHSKVGTSVPDPGI